jgi:hypothetical protein
MAVIPYSVVTNAYAVTFSPFEKEIVMRSVIKSAYAGGPFVVFKTHGSLMADKHKYAEDPTDSRV